MLGGLSDSTLGSWSFWLQVLGIAGALGVVVSLVGMHLVSVEISGRASRAVAPVEPLVASITGDQMVAAPARAEEKAPVAEKAPPKVAIALSKPVTREITEAQRTAFIDELSDSPKAPLPVIVCEDDPEIRAYADQIRVMLVLAGYDSGAAVKMNPTTSVSPVGVTIVVKDPARAPRLAGAIQNAFSSIGIVALGAKDDDFDKDQVAVVVGRKN